MDSARCKRTRKVVDAEELRYLQAVDRDGYVCAGCERAVRPCSFEPGKLVRPYFGLQKGEDHEPGCNVDGETKLAARGRSGRLSDESNRFPGGYPNRLDLPIEREQVDLMNGADDGHAKTARPQDDRVRGASQPGNRPYAAHTLRRVVRQFLNFPHDRHLELVVRGVPGRTYQEIFWRLKSSEIVEYTQPHLFYSPMRWNKLTDAEDTLEVLLDAGERDETGRSTRPYRLRILWSAWSERQRERVHRDLAVAQQEAIAAHKEGKRDEKAWIFFVGEQDSSDPTVLTTTDPRLICCTVTAMIYPPRAKQ